MFFGGCNVYDVVSHIAHLTILLSLRTILYKYRAHVYAMKTIKIICKQKKGEKKEEEKVKKRKKKANQAERESASKK